MSAEPTTPPLAWNYPFIEHLGIRPVLASGGLGRLEVTVLSHHLRDMGILHGGVLATLLDSVMGMAVGSVAPEGHTVVTVQLNVNFIRPAWEGERLVASAEVRHAGRQTAVARGEVQTSDGLLVGSGTGTFLFLPHPDPLGGRFPRRGEPGLGDSQAGGGSTVRPSADD